MSKEKTDLGDFILPFQINTLGIRGSLVRLQKTTQDLNGGNRYPVEIAKLLASTAALVGALSCGIKYKGVLSLQVQGNGPVSLLLAEISSEGNIRGYAKFNDKKLPKFDISHTLVPSLLGTGHMAFTVDQGPDTTRYQGITELSGTTLADSAEAYFRVSEQLDTTVVLESEFYANKTLHAGAFMIQKMPGTPCQSDYRSDPKHAWHEAALLASTLKASELLDPKLNAADLLLRLFCERGVKVFDFIPIQHACRCSRERVSNTLSSFPKTEVEKLKENGMVRVTCEFCNVEYAFDHENLHKLFDNPLGPSGP